MAFDRWRIDMDIEPDVLRVLALSRERTQWRVTRRAIPALWRPRWMRCAAGAASFPGAFRSGFA